MLPLFTMLDADDSDRFNGLVAKLVTEGDRTVVILPP
jgi:hypothetical protein